MLLFVSTLFKVDLHLTLKATNVNEWALYIHQNVKTMKEVRKLAICVRELNKDNKVNNEFSNIISRSDENLGQKINLQLKRYCEGNNFLFANDFNTDESSLNNSKLHLNHKGTYVLC